MTSDAGARPSTPHERRLIGSWRLRRWVAIADDGSEAHPLGDDPEGVLVYADDGTMVALMAERDRPRLASDDLTGGPEGEQAAAFASFIAYGGSFEVDGDTVSHHVRMSLFPNWVGTIQRRRWELDATGRFLNLTSPPISVAGTTRIQRLTWERTAG